MAATDLARPNGNGNGSLGPVEAPPRGVTAQLSYSGTPRFGLDGRTYPDEYSFEPSLRDPIRRMMTFEEMGNDDAVATAISSRCQDINSANWMLQSEDDSEQGQKIQTFVEDNLYNALDPLLRWFGEGPLQYGFTAIEPVFAWGDEPPAASITRGEFTRPTQATGQRQIWLSKLAHIRQRTVYSFRISVTGDLEYVWQWVFDGLTFRRIDIPPSKLLLRVFDKQGDDHWGLPPTRRCFGIWSHKKQYMRLNMLHHDKFGVGVPTLTEPQGGLTPQERSLWMAGASQWRAGAENALSIPFGSKLDIVTANGQLSDASLKHVQHLNGQIAKVFSTQQSELGSTKTGSRAVGETFDQQRISVIQADCEDIANIINNQLIIPLVKWNFGPQKDYPKFNPSQRVRANTTLATDLSLLVTSKLLTPQPEDEVDIRDRYELPPIPLEELQRQAEERKAQADAIATGAAGAAGGGPPNADGDPAKSAPPKPKLPTPNRIQARRVMLATDLADGAPEPAVPGESTYRTADFAAWEQEILRPDILGPALDAQTTRLAGEVQDVFAAIDASLAQQAVDAANGGLASLKAAVSTISVPGTLVNKLRRVMLAAAKRSQDYGAVSVRNELQRQLGPSGIGPQRPHRAPYLNLPYKTPSMYARFVERVRRLVAGTEPIGARDTRDLHIEAEVDRAVQDEIGRREQSARNAMLVAIAQAAGAAIATLASVVATAVTTALGELSPNRTADNVQQVVNVAFGHGRTQEAEAINVAKAVASGAAVPVPNAGLAQPDGTVTIDMEDEDGSAVAVQRPAAAPPGNRSGLVDAQGEPIELAFKYYSAVMDFGTCDECAMWDGAEFPIDYPEDLTGVQCPNPRCAGGARCRCVWIYATDQEARAETPASKGPVAYTQELVEELKALRAEIAKPGSPVNIAVTLEAPKAGAPVTRVVRPITEDGVTRYEMTSTPAPSEGA